MRLLKKEINNLPPRRKEILERKYFQDQKNAQIAKEMDISIHTVKVQLYKARLHLRSMIRKDDSKNRDRKSTRLNSSHVAISYAVFCLKKKTTTLFSVTDTRHTAI